MNWRAGPQANWVAQANRGELPEYLPAGKPFDARQLGNGALDDEALEPLTVFCEALESEANLTPLGRWATQRYLGRLIDQRFEVEALAAAPPIAEETIDSPIFVIGPPRSGTTVLHRLLAIDPSHRVAEGWELLYPASAGRTAAADEATKAAAATELSFPQSVAQGLRAIHLYSATMPKECLSAMALAFRTEEFVSRYHVPSYVDWLGRADLVPAYVMHRRVLQILQSRSTWSDRRWILKSPVHLQGLPELMEVYPDARIVMTHREPSEFLASVSSLIANLRSAFSNHVDAKAIGRYHLDLYAKSLSALEGHWDAGIIDPARIVHLHHTDIVTRPGSVVRRIYSDLGYRLDDTTHDAIVAASAGEREDGLGEHRYDSADFGFDADEIAERFAAYRSMAGFA